MISNDPKTLTQFKFESVTYQVIGAKDTLKHLKKIRFNLKYFTCNRPLSPSVLASASTRAWIASRRTAEDFSTPKASDRREFHGTDRKAPLESIGSREIGRFWGNTPFESVDFGTDEWSPSFLFLAFPCLAANGRELRILWAWFIHHLAGGLWPALLEKHWRIISIAARCSSSAGHKNKI